jgi:hypothetical protein
MKGKVAVFEKKQFSFCSPFNLIFLLLACWLLISSLPVFASQEMYGMGPWAKFVPQEQYELKFLGAILSKDGKPQLKPHQGLFLFIWKGTGPIEIFEAAYEHTTLKIFAPMFNFSVHHDNGWLLVGGEGDATGADWFLFQPGQVATFKADMTFVEEDVYAGRKWLMGADRAILHLDTNKGLLVSDEFPLPLVPHALK